HKGPHRRTQGRSGSIIQYVHEVGRVARKSCRAADLLNGDRMPSPPFQPQPPHRPAFARPRPAPGAASPDTVVGRMTPISHAGKLPWVQLRNALFHPNIFLKMIGRMDPRAKNGD